VSGSPLAALSLEASELKEELKLLLAASLDRVMDCFRQWDADGSNKISQREFAFACKRHLGLTQYARSAFDELFISIDKDRSGEIDYRELYAQLRRRVGDPSFHTGLARTSSADAASRHSSSGPAPSAAPPAPDGARFCEAPNAGETQVWFRSSLGNSQAAKKTIKRRPKVKARPKEGAASRPAWNGGTKLKTPAWGQW